MIPFVKMHGCGNDFIVLRECDARPAAGPEVGEHLGWIVPPPDLARRACDRRFGLGADGLLVYGPRPARDGVPHVRMLYWNADGSRAEMCGNGARCVARLAYEQDATGPAFVLETDAGPRPARVLLEGDPGREIEIEMGPPDWTPEGVPLRAAAPLVDARVEVGGEVLVVSALSMGNPHAVVFVADPQAVEGWPLATLGRALAEHDLFPRGANASVVAVSPGGLHLRVWERGAGATLACGTATCAAYAAARRTGRLSEDHARVRVPGGVVEVREAGDGRLWLRGPAVRVAAGVLSSELFAA
jgi:diaminopimelate epimerase